MTKLPEDVTESDGERNDTFFTYSESRPAALSFESFVRITNARIASSSLNIPSIGTSNLKQPKRKEQTKFQFIHYLNLNKSHQWYELTVSSQVPRVECG